MLSISPVSALMRCTAPSFAPLARCLHAGRPHRQGNMYGDDTVQEYSHWMAE